MGSFTLDEVACILLPDLRDWTRDSPTTGPPAGPPLSPFCSWPSRPQLHPDGPISRSPRCATVSLDLSTHGGYLDGLDEGARGRGDRTGAAVPAGLP